jgi:hypothetical protein
VFVKQGWGVEVAAGVGEFVVRWEKGGYHQLDVTVREL